jgi:hypothetical protein
MRKRKRNKSGHTKGAHDTGGCENSLPALFYVKNVTICVKEGQSVWKGRLGLGPKFVRKRGSIFGIP